MGNIITELNTISTYKLSDEGGWLDSHGDNSHTLELFPNALEGFTLSSVDCGEGWVGGVMLIASNEYQFFEEVASDTGPQTKTNLAQAILSKLDMSEGKITLWIEKELTKSFIEHGKLSISFRYDSHLAKDVICYGSDNIIHVLEKSGFTASFDGSVYKVGVPVGETL